MYDENTLDHIAPHKVSLSEVHNVIEGYFIPNRLNVRGVLRYLVLGESYGRVLVVMVLVVMVLVVMVLVVILEPVGTNEMRLITGYDAPDGKKSLYREKSKN